MMARALCLIATTMLSAACSTPTPTAPTAAPTAAAVTFRGDLTGEWIGTYTIATCSPTTVPGQCQRYVPSAPGTMRLTLIQDATRVTGTFTSDFIGDVLLPITGTVDANGVVRIAGAREGYWNPWQVGDRPHAQGLAVDSWRTEVTKDGGLAGDFRQLRQHTLSSFYSAMFEFPTSVVSLTRR